MIAPVNGGTEGMGAMSYGMCHLLLSLWVISYFSFDSIQRREREKNDTQPYVRVLIQIEMSRRSEGIGGDRSPFPSLQTFISISVEVFKGICHPDCTFNRWGMFRQKWFSALFFLRCHPLHLFSFSHALERFHPSAIIRFCMTVCSQDSSIFFGPQPRKKQGKDYCMPSSYLTGSLLGDAGKRLHNFCST